MCRAPERVSRGLPEAGEGPPETAAGARNGRPAAGERRCPAGCRDSPPGTGTGWCGTPRGGAAGAGRDYLTQASTLPGFAFTHFSAAASGVILSTAMYLATRFWSSFVQLKFFTRS